MQNHIFTTAYSQYYSKLLSYAHIYLSDYFLAEDFVQDFFLYVYEHFMDFPSEKLLFHVFFQKLSPKCQSSHYLFPYENKKFPMKCLYSDDMIYFQSFLKQDNNDRSQSIFSKIFLSLTPIEKKILHFTLNEKKNAKEIGILLSLSHCAVRKRMERLRFKINTLYKKLSNL